MKKVKEIIEVMETLAPTFLKEDFDNVGLMVGDREKEVKKVLLALDCTLKVVEEAKENNVDLIITHHPLIFRRPNNITTDTIQGRKIIELIKNDISLYSSHTNLDSAKSGLNDSIPKLLGYDSSEILEVNKRDEKAGLGRIVTLDKPTTLDEIVDNVKKALNINNLRVVKGKEEVNKIAIINGSGQDFIGKAVSKGADCIITGDTTYHFASDYKEMGINIIDAGHFASEQIVFFNVMKNIIDKFTDIEFILSKVEEDPYTFL
ncbi:Nif3-like dinuclear metal center hexameric protein [Clostridium sp. NSJ-49]|uniref:Nif3-like dinuclear metal center hexameric protein n=1 Tax=Clostridium TaxID=1485 RepID=UPI00164A2626|nr:MULTISPECIES: Nif3-like dinuclear metal center hexameric protein [unclassified Clostridium]MBC5624745.1 Nif3-like dinuclear metal center hexameric protein [Clostridium sp. NSJ-49]MCD2502512.1 Nif3-like dinuclear metal center hexameric protein [Clostridium sp. NSJ-145]MDU6340740.1 Nif3-like dinuclear metal center hexameric protein [Clostridium sp.]